MKVIFLLDNNEFIELDPTKLQLRQVAPGQAVLGYDVTVEVRDDAGTPKLKADGTVETTSGFRPIINYAVNLSVPAASLEEEITVLKTQLKARREELAKREVAELEAAKKVKRAKKTN